MAVCRCETHTPHGTKRRYIHSVRPVGYPDTAIICGSLSCFKPGLIWLEHDGAEAYRQGQRIFGAVTASMKMRAEGPESQTTHRSGTE
jgi:hypothetical protein